jgi:hypothetical protein
MFRLCSAHYSVWRFSVLLLRFSTVPTTTTGIGSQRNKSLQWRVRLRPRLVYEADANVRERPHICDNNTGIDTIVIKRRVKKPITFVATIGATTFVFRRPD